MLCLSPCDHPELTIPGGQTASPLAANARVCAIDGTLFYPFHSAVFRIWKGLTLEELRENYRQRLGSLYRTAAGGLNVIEYNSQKIHR